MTLGDAIRLRDNVPVKTVISPEDQQKLFRGYRVRDLNLVGSLDDTVYHSKEEVIGINYYCGHTFFFYKPPRGWYSQQKVYPDTCPLGDPSYIEV